MLKVIAALLRDWHDHDIRYCHWKSNADVERGLSGLGDLDVLASQSQAAAVSASLARCGFKRLVDHPGTGYPGIEHWIGYSSEDDAIAHVHLHFRLVFGEQFVKSYRLPQEEGILDRRIFDRGIYQASRSDELVFLFIRSILKINLVWLFRGLFASKRSYFPAHILAEYEFLGNQTTEIELRAATKRLLPGVEMDLSVAIGNFAVMSIDELITWRLRIKQQLRWFRRIRWHQSVCAATRAYWRLFLRRCGWSISRRRVMSTGGLRLAVLGADGAGKSTVVRDLEAWLRKHVDVRVLYGGSGDGRKTLSLRAVDAVTSVIAGPRRRQPSANSVSDAKHAPSRLQVLTRNARALFVALHRAKVVKLGRRAANSGSIVIYDRFPQTLQRDYSDGPKMLIGRGELSRRFYAWEARLYGAIYSFWPDYCILLQVDPAVSVARKPENKAEMVRLKNAVLEALVLDRPEQCVVIDSNQDYEKVLREVKGKVWAWL